MTQRTDECKATHDELCNQMQKHYDSLSAYGCEFHSGIPRAIEFYRQNAERSLPTYDCHEAPEQQEYNGHTRYCTAGLQPTTSGDEELVKEQKQDNEALLAEQLAKDILEELDTKDFEHNPAWDIARKQIETIIYPVLLTTKNQQIAAAKAEERQALIHSWNKAEQRLDGTTQGAINCIEQFRNTLNQ